jgi:UDP-N-acetylglucosamine 1-carboxyvinyltransferase
MFSSIKKEMHISGVQTPKGVVTVSGAKNSATRLLAAALISDEKVKFKNFPTQLLDVHYKVAFIEAMGGVIDIDNQKEELTINPSDIVDKQLPNYEATVRTTYLFAAGLLKKNGIARIPYPSGCKIGDRGYDLHIMVWEKFGAKVEEKEEYIEVTAKNGLKASDIQFPINTIGGTENALICAATINGTSTIKNAYISPEIEDLMDFLRSLGAEIETDGNSFIRIKGNSFLKGTIHAVIPDRIEALTWLVYGAITRGDITIRDVPFEKMKIPLIHIRECGIEFYQNDNEIIIRPECLKNNVIQPFELATGTHPGVISDMQPFFVLLGIFANGISRVHDYRYPDRLEYCKQLEKLFPNQLKWKKGQITTYGNLTSHRDMSSEQNVLESTDLRGSMAILLAALSKNSKTSIKDVQLAMRGYNNLIAKLRGLGIEVDIIDQQ